MGVNSYTEATEQDVPAEEQAAAVADAASRRSPITGTLGKRKKASSAFRTISEVAADLDVQQHVLRFWETKFSQIRPLKRGGGRRYYRPEDVELLRSIRHLLYTEGYTIKGVQKMLREQGKKSVAQAVSGNSATSASSQVSAAPVLEDRTPVVPAPANKLSPDQRDVLKGMLEDLKSLRSLIKAD